MIIRQGPLEQLSISRDHIDEIEEDIIMLKEPIHKLFLKKRVIDNKNKLIGRVSDIIILGNILEFIIVDEHRDSIITKEYEKKELYVLPGWFDKIGKDIHLNRTLEDIKFHNEDHSFKDELIHLVNGHI